MWQSGGAGYAGRNKRVAWAEGDGKADGTFGVGALWRDNFDKYIEKI